MNYTDIKVKLDNHKNLYATHTYSDQKSSKLVVLFPGTGYNCDKPLLYYGDSVALQQGYDTLCFDFKELPIFYNGRTNETDMDLLDDIISVSMKIIQELQDQYEELYFISKSYGTLIASNITTKWNQIPIHNCFLTPLLPILPLIEHMNCTVIMGTKDKVLPIEKAAYLTQRPNISFYPIEGVGHSLETFSNTSNSIQILSHIVDYYLEFMPK